MPPAIQTPVLRIGCFYDGSFFMNVSNYYRFDHERGRNLAFKGFQEFIRHRIAERENCDLHLARIVESHFFRGRFSLSSAKANNALESDRYVDQLLMWAGIVSHYYPMNESATPPEEKGIDVWLALEAYDLAVHKGFDVVVLFAGDQDFVPLVRKLHGIGTRVALVAMDAHWTDQRGRERYIRTSQALIDEAAHIVMLDQEVDARTARNDRVITALFE